MNPNFQIVPFTNLIDIGFWSKLSEVNILIYINIQKKLND